MALKEDLDLLKRLFILGDDDNFRQHVFTIVRTYRDEESKRAINQCIDELAEHTREKLESTLKDAQRLLQK